MTLLGGPSLQGIIFLNDCSTSQGIVFILQIMYGLWLWFQVYTFPQTNMEPEEEPFKEDSSP